MAIICFASASGAPGVTTSVLALGLCWPRRCMILEADPSGSSAINAGLYRSQAPERGVIDLAMAQRQGTLGTDIHNIWIKPPEGTTTVSDVRLILGPRSHGQAKNLTTLWEPLTESLRSMDRTGIDVLVDVGRLGTNASPTPLLRAADLTLLVTRTSLPDLAGARGWAAQLSSDYATLGEMTGLGLLLIGSGRPYRPKEISASLRLPVIAEIAWDPKTADVYHLGSQPKRRRFREAALSRSAHSAASAIRTVITENQDRLGARTHG